MGEASGQAGVVEVVVCSEVGVASHAVKGAGSVVGNAEAIPVDQAVLLAWDPPTKPTKDLPCSPQKE